MLFGYLLAHGVVLAQSSRTGVSAAVGAGYLTFSGTRLQAFEPGFLVSLGLAYRPTSSLAFVARSDTAWPDYINQRARLTMLAIGLQLMFPIRESAWEPHASLRGGSTWFSQDNVDGDGWVVGGAAGTSYWTGRSTALVAELMASYVTLDGDGDILTGVLDGDGDEDLASGILWTLAVGFRFTL